MRLADFPDLEKLTPEQKQELIDELKKTAIPKRRFIFGVDLDGVVMDFYGALKPIAAEYMGKQPDSLTDDYRYGLKEWGLMDIYIDDSPSNIESFSRINKPCIVFENPTNRHMDVPLRARNWEEVYDIVAAAIQR